ncbi:prealbumin-like fold domain-containing protein [bacterium 210820-DFI.6.37]|nr:prealbumin-like fold domain-containing protein [bacterium 210820-DFI.6.37]
MEITKTDVSTGEVLPNTGIRIYDSEKKVILEGYTDENGKLTFKKLPTGVYYFQEFDAPEGYEINKDLFKFEIKTDGEIVKCQMTDTAIITSDTPQTGQPWPFLLLALLVIAIGTGVYVIRNRKVFGNRK